MSQSSPFQKVEETLKDLPVAKVADDVVSSVKEGKVTVLTAETGSGKSLLASSKLAAESKDQVVVLVPRRFLAVNAAETIAEISGTEVGGDTVGYAIGRMGEGKAQFTPKTKLVFATYGYALSSGLLDTAKTIVCDEVHESGIDISLARAVIHKRMQTDKKLRVMEMSATLNAPKQASYWEDINSTQIFHAEGNTFPCDVRRTTEKSIPIIVRDLIKNEGRNGVAVFKPGVGEVEKTVEELQKLFLESDMPNVEVAAIYGDMDLEERAAAMAPPAPGNKKVLVGTNVIESGMNIKWLDAGVSDGLTKVPYYRESGAEALVTEELPQWRLIQQEGRIKRFKPGIFVLHSDVPFEDRKQENPPEITRISLNRLVLYAANYRQNPMDLKFDAPVDKKALQTAKEELMRLQLLTDDWQLTDKGEYVVGLPLGAEAGSIMWEASQKHPEILADAMQLAAIVEVGGLRADFRETHGKDKTSDVFDAMKAFNKLSKNATEEDCLKHNISWKRFKEAHELIDDIKQRHHVSADAPNRNATPSELRQLMLHGSVNRVFEVRDDVYHDMARNNPGYARDRDSVLPKGAQDRFAIGSLREFTLKSGAPMTVVNNVTAVPKDDFIRLLADRKDLLEDIQFTRSDKGRDSFTAKYAGKTPITIGIPKIEISDDMKRLIEPEYSEFLEQSPQPRPAGTHNTGAWEGQRQRTGGKKARG
ncbi:MAG: DEAD/DEAH box helicase [Rickettsiales bacterium]|nr:DEAD/DEAH box helicase [Rickettsiales bacterium]